MSDAVAPTEQRQPGMSDIMKYLGLRPAEFRAEWQALTEQDKADLKQWLRELWDIIGEPELKTGSASEYGKKS